MRAKARGLYNSALKNLPATFIEAAFINSQTACCETVIVTRLDSSGIHIMKVGIGRQRKIEGRKYFDESFETDNGGTVRLFRPNTCMGVVYYMAYRFSWEVDVVVSP